MGLRIVRGIKYFGAVPGRGGGGRIVEQFDGMNASSTIEKGSSGEIRITRRSFDLEGPVRELADDLRCLEVPRQELIGVLLAPRKRQDALLVASKNFLQRT